ncbi:MAG TPA: SRPBCC domain-containing protein [Candidatus Nanopelagicaceae bacterium]
MQDVITRSITVKASKERVYKAITDPKEIVLWFPDSVEGGTLEVGQEPIFSFESASHKRRVHIEASNPYDYFAYRWVPGPSGAGASDVLSIPNTLVEFSIEEIAGGTKVTVKESGFASLPIEEAESSFKDNSSGWGHMFDRLEKLLHTN